MPQDLLSFVNKIKSERPDELVSVSDEIDPAHAITATVVKTEYEIKKRPVFVFENVKGTNFKVMTNLHASRHRLAMSMGVAPREMQKKFLDAMENPIPPKKVNTGLCKEVILTGNEIDMRSLPQVVHHGDDGGAYITAAISFAKDGALLELFTLIENVLESSDLTLEPPLFIKSPPSLANIVNS